ncbi:hypothetical protein [Ruminococcus sp.]|uniref:hypothetical protein n=1 Tax=Ruminococcus sp. TaxID=41978 RepID=UPI00261D4A4B|nr:hypothetical protein [Ruminococcus sp.]
MMTYIRFLKNENGFVTYEYGKNKDEMIGTVTVNISNKENCKFFFYKSSKIQKFCTSTSHAIAMIYKFINQNSFPKEYVYAC